MSLQSDGATTYKRQAQATQQRASALCRTAATLVRDAVYLESVATAGVLIQIDFHLGKERHRFWSHAERDNTTHSRGTQQRLCRRRERQAGKATQTRKHERRKLSLIHI